MAGIKSILKKCLLSTLRLYCKTILRTGAKFQPQDVRRVLVYAYTGLGNIIMYMPTLRAIKKFLPQASFTLLHANDTGCQEVVSGSDLFDDYIVVKKNADWPTRLKCVRTIRRRKYDLVISEFHNVFPFMNLITILGGIRYRLGHVSSPGWKNNWDLIYNIPVQMKEKQHETERYLELACALGIEKKEVDKKPVIYTNSDDREFAKKFLASHGVNSRDRIVSVQPGTSPSHRWKQWNLAGYGELCDKIMKLPNTRVILHGSPNEADMVEEMADKMNEKPIIAAGKTSIMQAAAIIEESDLVICNDSGLMHVAVAVDTPVVAIYGPTDYTRTAPLGEKHTVIRKNFTCSPCFRLDGLEKVENCPYSYKCLNSISVEEVFESVTKKLMGG